MTKKLLLNIALGMMFTVAAMAQTAKVQVIHNCADTSAALVDVYINGTLALDNFGFRKATPFIDLQADTIINIAIAPSNSDSIIDSLISFNFNFADSGKYVIVANGLISSSGYTPSQAFSLDLFSAGQMNSAIAGNTDILVCHGATDAPAVDILAGTTTLIDDITYPNFNSSYLQVPTSDLTLTVTDASGTNTVAMYSAPLATLGLQDSALVAVASGFLTPANNSNGAAFGIWVALPSGGNLIPLPVVTVSVPAVAKVQVIHNCADTSAALVDVYINGTLALDNFGFRTATPFIDLQADTMINIAVAPSNSTSIADTLVSFNFNFADSGKYVIVANGLISSSGYTPSQAFSLDLFSAGQMNSAIAGNTDILVCHGATDAPAVDILTGTTTLIDNISYPNFNSSYLQVPTSNLTLTVTDATGADTVSMHSAPLATLGLQDSALVAVASGFLTPANNSNGAAFGIWVALPSGGNLIPLPVITISNTPNASVQIIHDCADKAARVVDIWLNDSLIVNDFTFRTCTPFINVPAVDTITISIQPSNSVNTANPIAQFTYNLMANEQYILIANGTVSSSGYNPTQPFNLDVFTGAQQSSGNPTNTNVLVYHGATDAPPVNVVSGTTTLVDSIYYGQFNGSYLQLPTIDYTIALTDTLNDTIAKYSAPLSALNLQGQSLVVLASGFINRAANRNGSIFGLWVALPAGGNLIPLQHLVEDSARVQIIHNSGDVSLATVDVWYNDVLLLDNFAFRNSTPFISIPADTDFDLTFTDASSTDTITEKGRFYYKLEDKTYIMVSQGNVGTTGYDPIVPFGVSTYDQGKENSGNASNTSVLVYHGATDAPVVDVTSNGNILVDNLDFSEFSNGYLELPTANYTINLKEGFGSTILASYTAPLSTMAMQGKAIVIVASGFMNTNSNSNGEDFGLWGSLAAGGALIPLPVVTSLTKSSNENQIVLYPNPASNQLNILNLGIGENNLINIYNQLGEIVFSKSISTNGNSSASVEIDNLPNGLYTVEVSNNSKRFTSKISIIK
jgi:hypothetical protein